MNMYICVLYQLVSMHTSYNANPAYMNINEYNINPLINPTEAQLSPAITTCKTIWLIGLMFRWASDIDFCINNGHHNALNSSVHILYTHAYVVCIYT